MWSSTKMARPRAGRSGAVSMRWILPICLAVVLGGSATPDPEGASAPSAGADSQPSPDVASAKISSPDWIHLPNADDLARYYPKAASRQGISGRAVMQCKVNAQGRLEDCAVLSEDPVGWDFGDAELKLAPFFRMTAKTPDGKSVAGASVTIPMRFTLAR